MAQKRKKTTSKKTSKKASSGGALLPSLLATMIIVVGILATYFVYVTYLKEDGPEISGGTGDIEIGAVVDGQVAVYYMDIGQGDATLIVAPTGEKMLIDAGKSQHPSYEVDTDDLFSEYGIDELDYFVITHYDYDHIGSGKNVLDQCEVKNILAYDYEPTSATGQKLQTAFAEEKGAALLSPERGYTFTMGGVHFEVLSEKITEANRDKSNENDNSICLMMTYGDTKFLFTGDGEEDREEELIENYGKKLDADVFQAGHHGAKNANTKEFLDLVTPDCTVFSCGEGNKYNHPTEDALDHVDDHSEYILRTDRHGTVLITSNGKKINYQTEKQVEETADIGGIIVCALLPQTAFKAA